MACVNADGTVTASAQAVLKSLQGGGTALDVTRATQFALFRVRSILRELAEAGLIAEGEGRYQLTETGKARLGG